MKSRHTCESVKPAKPFDRMPSSHSSPGNPMTMITIFTIPKPFCGHIGIIQRNAIKSWLALGPTIEILLMGDEEGIEEIASEFKLKLFPSIKRNEFGTPTVSSAFEIAQGAARGAIMAFANADIILTKDVVEAVGRVPFDKFLISFQRWDLDVESEIDVETSEWEERLREQVRAKGRPHGPGGMDCFIFPRGLFPKLPPFGIGRPGWDNWLIYRARSLGASVIDATDVIMAVHQNHDYSHHPEGLEGVWMGEEAARNLSLAGGRYYIFDLRDSDWVMDSTGLKKSPLTRTRLFKLIKSLPALHPRLARLFKVLLFFPRLFFSSLPRPIREKVAGGIVQGKPTRRHTERPPDLDTRRGMP